MNRYASVSVLSGLKVIQCLQMVSEVLGTHRWGLGGPAGRTHLAVGLHKLEGLHQTKGLFDRPAHWQVVHTHVLHYTTWINNEQTPVGQQASF